MTRWRISEKSAEGESGTEPANLSGKRTAKYFTVCETSFFTGLVFSVRRFFFGLFYSNAQALLTWKQ